MAILVVVSVRDRAIGAFARPFSAPSAGVAIRSFIDEVNREGSDMGAHPTDYELYEVGSFDDVLGQFSNPPAPNLLIRAEDAKK